VSIRKMTSVDFEKKLKQLEHDVLSLGDMVERAIYSSVQALKGRDLKAAGQIIADDLKINQKRHDIEEKCIELIATQQPVASDLRVIIAILNIIVDLERMADHAEGIAKIVLMIGYEPPLKPLVGIPRMADKGREMLRQSLSAFTRRDIEAAKRICAEDDEVDHLHDQVYRELLTFILEDPRTITKATRLLWVAHNLERIADRVTNICERVVFMVTGEMIEIGSSKY
jgi:phosphate transport system protein